MKPESSIPESPTPPPVDERLEERNLILDKLRSMIRELEPVMESEKKGGFIGTSYEIGGIHDAIVEIEAMPLATRSVSEVAE